MRTPFTVTALCFAILANSQLTVSEAGASERRAVTVEFAEDTFVPAVIKARPGDTVVFINRDPHLHSVTAPKHPTLPEDEFVEASETFSFTVPEHLSPGEYPLFCSIHIDMTAVLVVPAELKSR